MANLSQKEINEIKAALKEQADIQAKINASAGDYIGLIKEIKHLNQSIASIKAQQAIQDKKSKDASDAYLKAKTATIPVSKIELDLLEKQAKLEKIKLGIISDELDKIEKTTKALATQAKQVNKTAAVFKSAFGDIKNITSVIAKGYSKLDGLFKMDKSIKTAALQMGILSKQSTSFAKGITDAANNTIEFGVGIDDLAKMQAAYSEELGRTVTLSQKGLEAMGEMASATNLGADGAGALAASLDNVGLSTERTRDYVEQTMNDAHAMGLNASKVIKNIASNVKMLNKYNFKGGVKGLAKMAETTTKLGVDMSFVGGMAEKLFDIEGAVDMSAQLQVLGGAWAKLADPFKLMYMARNDMEGLTEELGKAAESSAHFNKQTGEFEISALEMQRLRKVAEQTGVSYEDLAQAGKNAAKFTKIKGQLGFNVDKKTQEFLESTAQFNDKGEATINIDGSNKVLKTLTQSDKIRLDQMISEKESLKERAKDSRTFDDALNNTMTLFKQLMLPIVEALNKQLLPKVDGLVKQFKDSKMLDKLQGFASSVGNFIAGIGKFVITFPKLTAGLFLGFQALKWFMYGRTLGMGFNSVARAGGGMGGLGGGVKGMMNGASMMKGGNMMGGLGAMGKGLGKTALPFALAGAGMDLYSNLTDDDLSWSDSLLKTLDQHKGMAAGAAIGSAIPVVGTAVGAGIGGIADMFMPEIGTYGKGAHDAIFNSPIHDGMLGSDFNKGRGIIQGGKITPIDNKDDLMAYKPRGPIDNSMKNQSPSSMKIEFGEIHFKFDEIKVTSPGSPGVAIDLIKNPEFIRNITRMVHVETNKAISGGVLSPNPKGK